MEEARMRVSMARKLSLLYSLNIADWICTVILLRSGRFYEANPLMSAVIDNISLSFVIKCVVPIFMIRLIIRLTRQLDREGLKKVDRIVAFVLALYTALCVDHIVNFLILYFG